MQLCIAIHMYIKKALIYILWIQMYVVLPLIVNPNVCCTSTNCDSNTICLKLHYRSNSVVGDSPSVCANEDSGETRKFYTQFVLSICCWLLKMVYISSQGLVPPIYIHQGFGGLRTYNVGKTPKSIVMLAYTYALII